MASIPTDIAAEELIHDVAVAMFYRDHPEGNWFTVTPQTRNEYLAESKDLCASTITALYGEQSTR